MVKETRMCSTSELNWEDIRGVCDVSLTSVVILCGGIPSIDTSSTTVEILVTATSAYLDFSKLIRES